MIRPDHSPMPVWRQALIFAACLAVILAIIAAALGALLVPHVLWGALTDFAAPTAAQARAEGWAALSERA